MGVYPLRRRPAPLQAWSRSGADGTAGSWSSLFVDGGPYESAWRGVEHELERMQEAARAHGAAFAVVALPQKPPWSDIEAYPETRLARWSAAHGAVFVPTLAALRAAETSRTLYWQRTDTAPRRGTQSLPRPSPVR